MGREAKILLAFLGLLAGVFCGVLSMKLLVPRPPAGAGPDIHGADTFLGSTEIVEPPLLPLRAADFAAAPPLANDGRTRPPESLASGSDPLDGRVAPAAATTRFPAARPAALEAEPIPDPAAAPASDDLLPPPAEFVLAAPARPIDEPPSPPAEFPAAVPRDPFLSRTAWNPPEAADADPLDAPRAAADAPPPPAVGTMPAAAAPSPVVAAGSHVVRAGDSWWSLAEAAYGDGRLYRALFAWNRALDPRFSLTAGTQLEVPPLDKLRAAWPQLVPPTGP